MHNGEPWVFDARRTSIPACTVSESHEKYLALMASDEDDVSHRASCSMEADDEGRMLHRLYYPRMERPLTYCTRDGYAPAHDDWLTPASGQTITAVAYVLAGKPLFPSFSMANVEDAALTLFLPQPCFSRF